MLKNEALKGALIYYDGQHNDARMNLAIILTAIRQGAKCVNHVAVETLLKDEQGKVKGAKVKDMVGLVPLPVNRPLSDNRSPVGDSGQGRGQRDGPLH